MLLKKNVLALVVSVAVCLGGSFFFLSAFDTSREKAVSAVSTEEPESSERLYGLVVDGYGIETNVVGRNEFLSDILQRYGVSLSRVAEIAERSKPVFDVRKISVAQQY